MALVQAAARAEADPRQWRAMLEAVATLEVERQARELDETDQTVLDAASEGGGHLVGDHRGFYPSHWGWWARAGADGRTERVNPPRRVLWRAWGRELAVVDRPPVPAAHVRALVRKGVLRPHKLAETRWSPYRDYFVHQGDYTFTPGWQVVPSSERAQDGAWLLAVDGEPIAWALHARNAEHAARAVNACARLSGEVGGFGAASLLKRGLAGAVRALCSRLEPERATPAPAELRERCRQAADALEAVLCDTETWEKGRGVRPHASKPDAG